MTFFIVQLSPLFCHFLPHACRIMRLNWEKVYLHQPVWSNCAWHNSTFFTLCNWVVIFNCHVYTHFLFSLQILAEIEALRIDFCKKNGVVFEHATQYSRANGEFCKSDINWFSFSIALPESLLLVNFCHSVKWWVGN